MEQLEKGLRDVLAKEARTRRKDEAATWVRDKTETQPERLNEGKQTEEQVREETRWKNTPTAEPQRRHKGSTYRRLREQAWRRQRAWCKED